MCCAIGFGLDFWTLDMIWNWVSFGFGFDVVRHMLCVYGQYVNFCDKVALMRVPIVVMGGPLGCLAGFTFFWTPVRTMSPKDMIGMGQSWLVQ